MTLHANPSPTDAIGVLIQNRASVNRLLDAYAALCDRTGDTASEKLAIVERVSLDVTLDTQVEEELLFPALNVAGIDLQPFQGFHDTAWALIAQLSMGEPGDLRFDSQVLLIGRDLMQRMQQVHDRTLPLLPGSGIDLVALGERMLARKATLMDAFDRPAEEEDEDDDPVGRPMSGLLH
jgi:hypothetical protein